MDLEWKRLECETGSTQAGTPIRYVTTTILGGNPVEFVVEMPEPGLAIQEMAKFLWRLRRLGREPLK
jgi:hypothetical protein